MKRRLSSRPQGLYSAVSGGSDFAARDYGHEEGVENEETIPSSPSSADPACLAFAASVNVRDRRLNGDALNASTRNAGERRDLDLTVTGASQNLDFVPLEHVDHPFPRCLVQRVCDPKGSAQSGQNFRKRSGQNLRNPH